MVFGNCGVLQEMSADKGFVEMTGIDAETSQDIAEVCRLVYTIVSMEICNHAKYFPIRPSRVKEVVI